MTDKLVFGSGDGSYQAAGGMDGIRQLVDDFYQVMDSAPEARRIRQMHPEDLTLARDKLACFLSGWLGGPKRFQQTYGRIHIPAFHARWPIDTDDANAWLYCMQEAIARQPWDALFKDYLLRQLAVPAQRIVQAAQARLHSQQ